MECATTHSSSSHSALFTSHHKRRRTQIYIWAFDFRVDFWFLGFICILAYVVLGFIRPFIGVHRCARQFPQIKPQVYWALFEGLVVGWDCCGVCKNSNVLQYVLQYVFQCVLQFVLHWVGYGIVVSFAELGEFREVRDCSRLTAPHTATESREIRD